MHDFAGKTVLHAVRARLAAFFDVPFGLDEEARRKRRFEILLQVSGLGVALMLGVVFWAALFDQTATTQNLSSTTFDILVFLLGLLVSYFIHRAGHSQLARILFVGLCYLGLTFETPLEIAYGRSLIFLAVFILFAGILIHPRASFAAAGLTSLLVWYLSTAFSLPNPAPRIVAFFLIAQLSWMATDSLEKHIQRLLETNTRLQKSEAHYQTLLETSPNPVALCTPDGQLTYLNRAGLRALALENLEEAGGALDNWIATEDRERFQADFARLVATGTLITGECRARDKNGRLYDVEYALALVLDESGRPQTVLLTATDVTLRKQTERDLRLDVSARTLALHRTSQRLEELVANSPTVIYSLAAGATGQIQYLSGNVEAMLGYPARQFLENEAFWRQQLHPEDQEAARLDWQALQTVGKANREYRLRHQDGTYRWIRDEIRRVETPEETSMELVGSWTEVTEQKETEAAYRSLAENSAQGLMLLQNNRIILANTAYTRLVGLSQEEIYAMPEGKIFETIHPDDQERAKDNLRARLAQRSVPDKYEIRLVHRDGTIAWVEIMPTLVSMRGIPAVQVTLMNITERKQAEQATREAHAHLQAMLNAIPDLFFEMDAGRRFISYRSVLAEQLYTTPEIFLGKTAEEVLPAEVAQVISGALDEALRYGHHHGATYALTLPGGVNWFELSISTLGKMTQPSDRYLILVRNITARKRAENALRESEERYRSLAESAEDIIFIVSPENRIEYVNQYAAKLLGKRPEEIRGNTNQGYFHFLEAKEPNQEITEVFQNSIPVHAENHVRIGEHELWLSTHLVPLKDPFGKVKSVLGVSRDISERKALELLERDQKNQLEQRVAERTAELAASHEQLRQLARQVVSAQEDERRHLAREIHDESGQALLDLKFTLDEVLSDLPVDPELVRQKASRVFGKIDSLDQQLHALSSGLRPPILDVAGIDLALRSLCQETSKKKQLNVTYQGLELPDLPEEIAITLYRCVQEALTNMHKYAQATEARVKLEYISPGPIRLSVWDNGIGFEIGSISRGIGLSGMEERFDLLGGHLEINSAPGQGTHLKAVVPFPHAPTS